MSVYLDPSVIVSLFISDASSPQADKILRTAQIDIVVSNFAAAEFASVLSRRVRARELTAAHARTVFAEFDEWCLRSVQLVEIASEDIAAAASLLRRLNTTLRTPDALHLALTGRLQVQLLTFDKKMSAAARALGVEVFVRA